MHFKPIKKKTQTQRPKFEISYFSSRRMWFPSQLPGLGTGDTEHQVSFVPLKDAKGSSSALPQLPGLCRGRASTSQPLHQAGSGPWRRHSPFSLCSGQPGPVGILSPMQNEWIWHTFLAAGQGANQPRALSDGNRATNGRIAQAGVK